jgi:hypothetical protein
VTVKRRAFVEALLEQDGCPYVWGGKGLQLWGWPGMQNHTFGMPVFDCSGLVTFALWRAGGPDWRGSHNAQVLHDASTLVTTPRAGNLLFYGRSTSAVTHVAVLLSSELTLKIEAAGGDHRTIMPKFPLHDARVSVRLENRTDFVGERCLPSSLLEYAF